VGATSDVNPQNPATLRDGGDLRLALTEFPSNFNTLHIDGNSADVGGMLKATMPRAFVIGPDGSTTVDTDYFSSVELTGTNPQVVTYTINPKATWSDGTPLRWEDIASQIRATNGADKTFAIAGTNGSERVKSVTRGVDDRQAVITFAKPYAEWRGMFAGNTMLLPKSMTATPEAFNRAQLSGPGPSAGPFIVSELDRTRQRIVLTRNPNWWGERPRLDRITFLVLDDSARLPALQNKAIDATGVGSLDQLTIARRTKGISIRRAPTPSWYHFTFNGAKGSILADPALRRAVAEGIDRTSIAAVAQHGLSSDPAALNNHIYVQGQQGYQDNSSVVAYNPDKAKQHSLAEIGIRLDLLAKAGSGFFTNYINVGAFDIAQFGWQGDAFPLSALTQIYASGGESNFGKIGGAVIDATIEQTLQELDSAKARALANEVDKLIWAEGFSLPLTQSPGNVAVNSSLANFGAAGLADLDYTAIGFMQ
jgi:peptide/nickel transport system substrate-binding protein